MQAQEVAYKLVQGIQNALIENPPDGVDSAYAESWFQSNFASVQALFTKTLAPLLAPLAERLDQENKLKWHMQSADSVRAWAAKSSREEQDWLVSRMLAHRPDLINTAEAISSQHGLDFDTLRTTSRTVYRMVPAVSEDRLVIYEADGLTELPQVLGREDFVGFAKAAYWSDDATAPSLVELAAGGGPCRATGAAHPADKAGGHPGRAASRGASANPAATAGRSEDGGTEGSLSEPAEAGPEPGPQPS